MDNLEQVSEVETKTNASLAQILVTKPLLTKQLYKMVSQLDPDPSRPRWSKIYIGRGKAYACCNGVYLVWLDVEGTEDLEPVGVDKKILKGFIDGVVSELPASDQESLHAFSTLEKLRETSVCKLDEGGAVPYFNPILLQKIALSVVDNKKRIGGGFKLVGKDEMEVFTVYHGKDAVGLIMPMRGGR